MTFKLGVIGMTSKYTILCTSITTSTSITRLGRIFRIGHIGTELTFSLTDCTGLLHSGCYRAQREDKFPIVVESNAMVWVIRESVYNSSSSLLSSSNLSDNCLKSDESFD